MADYTAPLSKAARWTGYVFSALPALMLLLGGVMSVTRNPTALEGMPQMGYPVHLAVPIGIVALLCAVLYLIPRTAVLGAILMTGYLGGATATHVRVEDGGFGPALVAGVLVWGGLYLRDPRIRALIPLRAPAPKPGSVEQASVAQAPAQPRPNSGPGNPLAE